MKTSHKPSLEPPPYLSDAAREWFRSVSAQYALEDHHVWLLTMAAQAWDRWTQARKLLDDNGLTYTDSNDNPRSRPEVAIERDNRLAVAKMLRELALDVANGSSEADRPPRLIGNAHRRAAAGESR